jgi:hypothetical protein
MGPGVSVLSSGGPRYEKNVVQVDYYWVLEDVTATKEVTLVCPFSVHRVTLGADNVREYRSPNFLMLKCQLILEEIRFASNRCSQPAASR